MKSLLRVLRAPGLILSLWLLHLGFAGWIVRPLRGAFQGALAPFVAPDSTRLLFSTAELLNEHHEFISLFAEVFFSSAGAGIVFSVLTAGGIFTRLHQKRTASEILAASGKYLVPVAVQTLWIWIVRILLLILGALCLQATFVVQVAGTALILLGLSVTAPAQDLSRIAIILGDGRPYHPKTTICALKCAFQQVKLWLGSMGITLVKWGIVALLFVVLTGKGDQPYAIWLARFAAFLGISLSLWRSALALLCFEQNRKPS